MPKFAVIIPAAGRAARFCSDCPAVSFLEKKPFIPLAGKAVWLWSAEKFAARSDVVQIILVTAPEDTEPVRVYFNDDLKRLGIQVISGGTKRCLSVENALAVVSPEADYIAVHDAARPCISSESIDAVFRAACVRRAAILASPIVGTVKKGREGEQGEVLIERTVPRVGLWEAQTPQVFEAGLYRQAAQSRALRETPTDDAGLLEAIGISPLLVEGPRTNIKITTRSDLSIAECVLEGFSPGE